MATEPDRPVDDGAEEHDVLNDIAVIIRLTQDHRVDVDADVQERITEALVEAELIRVLASVNPRSAHSSADTGSAVSQWSCGRVAR